MLGLDWPRAQPEANLFLTLSTSTQYTPKVEYNYYMYMHMGKHCIHVYLACIFAYCIVLFTEAYQITVDCDTQWFLSPFPTDNTSSTKSCFWSCAEWLDCVKSSGVIRVLRCK